MKKLFLLLLIVVGFLFTFGVKANASYYYGPVWSLDKPIQVYIPQGNKYSVNMLHAFQRWQGASSNKITFKYLKEEKDADIVVKFVDSVDGSDGDVGSYTVGVQGNRIKHAEINIVNNNDKEHSADMMFTTMLHEIGHVLGMSDSGRTLGIMRTPVTSSQDINKRDIMVLYKLYGWSLMTGEPMPRRQLPKND